MSISDTLEVGIGLIFVYLLLSLVCSAAREMMEAFFKTRAMNLELGIRQLLCDPPKATWRWSLPFSTTVTSWFWRWVMDLFSWIPFPSTQVYNFFTDNEPEQDRVTQFYNHPLIRGLYDGKYEDKNLPAYIPARTFALALMDLVMPPTETSKSGAAGATAALDFPPAEAPLQPLRDKVTALADGQLKNALLPLIDAAGNNVAQARENIENWFNGSMDRVSGWYKRHTQWILFWLGFGVTLALNVNTLTIADHLMTNPDARQALVARAEEVAKLPPPQDRKPEDIKEGKENLDAAIADVKSLKLPIGWTIEQQGWIHGGWWQCNLYVCQVPYYWIAKIDRPFWDFVWHSLPGWLVTALAISLGSPFWFDTLNRIMVVRSTVKPNAKSPLEPAIDPMTPLAERQGRPSPGA